LRTIRIPGIIAFVVTAIAVLLGARSVLVALFVGIATFAVGTNIIMIVRTLKAGWLRIGGYLAHVGIMIFVVGAIASSWYATPETRVLVPEGQSMSIYGYDIAFNGWRMDATGHGVLDMHVTRNGRVTPAAPMLYFNPRMGATMATPSIRSEFYQDMYISPVEYQPPFDRNIADLNEGQTKEIGPYAITFNGFVVPTDKSTDKSDISAQLSIVYAGKTYAISPGIVILANESDPNKAVQEMPVDLPGGHTASMAAFDPNQKRVIIRVGGLNLPVDPARAVITVAVKPGILFVWAGIIIAVIGGVIAVIRRQYEAGQLTLPSLKSAFAALAFWRRKDSVTA